MKRYLCLVVSYPLSYHAFDLSKALEFATVDAHCPVHNASTAATVVDSQTGSGDSVMESPYKRRAPIQRMRVPKTGPGSASLGSERVRRNVMRSAVDSSALSAPADSTSSASAVSNDVSGRGRKRKASRRFQSEEFETGSPSPTGHRKKLRAEHQHHPESHQHHHPQHSDDHLNDDDRRGNRSSSSVRDGSSSGSSLSQSPPYSARSGASSGRIRALSSSSMSSPPAPLTIGIVADVSHAKPPRRNLVQLMRKNTSAKYHIER